MNNEERLDMGVLQRIGSFFSLHDEEEFDEAEASNGSQPSQAAPPARNVVSLANVGRRAGSGVEVSVYAPKSFTEVTELADALRNKQVVIVNMQSADRVLLQRVIDFTSGVAYTLDGRIQKLAEAIFLVVPSGVTVNAQGLRESLGGDSMIDFMSNRG
jgi:cell division inhibitor SepF